MLIEVARAGELDRKLFSTAQKKDIHHGGSNKKFSMVGIAVFIKLNGVVLDFK